VTYLGMRIRTLRGMRNLRSIAKEIEHAAAAKPDGLLRHDTRWYPLIPPHGGMRQYWRDFNALSSNRPWKRSCGTCLPRKPGQRGLAGLRLFAEAKAGVAPRVA
jgi:hypothetical protein